MSTYIPVPKHIKEHQHTDKLVDVNNQSKITSHKEPFTQDKLNVITLKLTKQTYRNTEMCNTKMTLGLKVHHVWKLHIKAQICASTLLYLKISTPR